VAQNAEDVVAGFARRYAAKPSGWKYRCLVEVSLMVARWILQQQIRYFIHRFRAARQDEIVMIGIERIAQS
jgi:chorismate mutase